MTRMLIIAAAAVAMAAGVPASADEALAKSAGCLTCHALDAKKMGPSFKDIAAKHKGNAKAETELAARLAEGKKHPPAKGKPEDTARLVKWVLAQ